MAKKVGAHEKKFEKVLDEYKKGKLHSGSKKGPKVKSRKQALAIAFSEAKKDVRGRMPKTLRKKR